MTRTAMVACALAMACTADNPDYVAPGIAAPPTDAARADDLVLVGAPDLAVAADLSTLPDIVEVDDASALDFSSPDLFVCPTGFVDCDGDPANGCEVDTRTDPNNCSGCGLSCAWPNIVPHCANSRCDGSCYPGFADCDGKARLNGCEIDLMNDAANCGSCGLACANGRTCAGGMCR